MRLIFSSRAWGDYKHWAENDRKLLKRINKLVDDIMREPFDGIGKPEPLRGNLKGYWSRRITDEHRLVYKVVDDSIFIAQMKYHYE